ncbi:thioredoxin [Sporolactobacillus sp. THM7-4]|nr:thioredoxin [Sporolactobacillus sp. THM7-4]
MKAIQSTEEFEKVISSPETVMVKFETTWCPDCKRLNMYIDDIIKDFHFKWYSADRDKFPDLGREYQVLGIPSLLAFKNGEKKAHLRADDKSPEEIRDYLKTIEA